MSWGMSCEGVARETVRGPLGRLDQGTSTRGRTLQPRSDRLQADCLKGNEDIGTSANPTVYPMVEQSERKK